ncbi:MAG: pyruvate ferredoxin oxidoreductase [Candidatus Latescibacteria bacterium]|nr:pyruvate ferredoxin oxidoreductase [Candidatus Latescibacterota bacterium]NIM66341.1 pyruvate ferredoxin oxidoreductase [Candidatus Latescibacterota bacterium]NIO02820.1 pyruvate ferredoxin oxidoreductase [Candidatus Latescibacterota bacterium]NIO29955.1 pyruvate ferredoxin oxidoreductase [Candidatus Latescibacterota bacterium]NIO57570.1 pyruvate ferredoxin oxidoreductase [Candidatus Latescibacterota bacterium]
MSRTEIRITGFGGQGVVLSGYIIGRACSINSNKHATMIQSFGPEARGSACSATLAVSETEVLYPYIARPDIFIVMSAEGYDKFGDELKDDGTLIYEKDLVHPTLKEGQPSFGIPSTRIAENLGRTIIQNIVMLGFFTGVTGLITREAMRDAVKASVPAGTEELNLKAFDAGYAYYEEEYSRGKQSEEKGAVAAETAEKSQSE